MRKEFYHYKLYYFAKYLINSINENNQNIDKLFDNEFEIINENINTDHKNNDISKYQYEYNLNQAKEQFYNLKDCIVPKNIWEAYQQLIKKPYHNSYLQNHLDDIYDQTDSLYISLERIENLLENETDLNKITNKLTAIHNDVKNIPSNVEKRYTTSIQAILIAAGIAVFIYYIFKWIF